MLNEPKSYTKIVSKSQFLDFSMDFKINKDINNYCLFLYRLFQSKN